MPEPRTESAEVVRLREDAQREKNWKRWGPYLSERQWGTVREDYSPDGNAWDYFTHDQARSRCYRWGEDGLLGVCDRECRLCFSVALWNGRDPILKERLFGLNGHEGNHGEDVKEEYFYIDSTPTHSYLKAIYKYSHAEFPYAQLVTENGRRTRKDPEFELADTGIFNEGRYFDVQAEYAKNSPNDILIRITATNHGPEAAMLHLVPQLFYRNSWSWGCKHEGCEIKPRMSLDSDGIVRCDHVTLGKSLFYVEEFDRGGVEWMFTENETNAERIFGATNASAHVRDAFHDYVVHGRTSAINPSHVGTKVGARFATEIAAGASVTLRLRLAPPEEAPADPFGPAFDEIFRQRIVDADAFYAGKIPANLTPEQKLIARQAYAGLLWSKQFYHYVVKDWLEGDPQMPPPPKERLKGRNSDWNLLFNRDVISMPDKWEYPWYASWDLAFHCVCFAHIDPQFAKDQLILLMREWYMHPSGQIPAYEWSLSDVNPPVHAWACWRVYKMTGSRGERDRAFLERAFHKLMINFTWWVNRKDIHGRNIFGGGFLGLDNIGVFDRSQPLPDGAMLEQADGTAWMAFFAGTMLSMALELAASDPVYEDVASKFFEHFIGIVDTINTLGGTGLWDDDDGFYYDRMETPDGVGRRLKIRSMVGLIPLLACEVLEDTVIDRLPGFKKRLVWFVEHRADLARHISYLEHRHHHGRGLLAVPSQEKLLRVLKVVLDENELLSPFGVRSLSKIHGEKPFVFEQDGRKFEAHYSPGESGTELFGGNSNWRGPVWFPLNYLLIEALEKYFHFYHDELQIEFPTGSGKMMDLRAVAEELERRLTSLFQTDPKTGHRPYENENRPFAGQAGWKDLILFHEYFHGETGRGLGASHQTGWTALLVRMLQNLARAEPEE